MGWGNEIEPGKQEQILQNLLRRKTTVGTLPKIGDGNRKLSPKKYSHAKVSSVDQEQRQTRCKTENKESV